MAAVGVPVVVVIPAHHVPAHRAGEVHHHPAEVPVVPGAVIPPQAALPEAAVHQGVVIQAAPAGVPVVPGGLPALPGVAPVLPRAAKEALQL